MCRKRKKTISVNVLGCCVSRDIFRIAQNQLGDIPFEVRAFFQTLNPVSAYTAYFPPYESLKEDKLVCGNWWKKCLINELHKTILTSVQSTPADFLVIDLGEVRLRLRRLFYQGSTYYTTMSVPYNDNAVYMAELEKSAEKRDMVFAYELDDEFFKDVMQWYANEIAKAVNYNMSKLIVLDIEPTFDFLNADGKIEQFKDGKFGWFDLKEVKSIIKRSLDIFLETLDCKNIIPFPENTTAFENHIWGNQPLHYTDDYYMYAYKAVCIAVNKHIRNKTKAIEKELLLVKHAYDALRTPPPEFIE